ncbi:MAG: hypothetical protein HY831_04275 [Candidatus Aenigmarchaeota archaeon]|nr:hypothetical protein [Candidatus Aenigmarchaeota archaeon]
MAMVVGLIGEKGTRHQVSGVPRLGTVDQGSNVVYLDVYRGDNGKTVCDLGMTSTGEFYELALLVPADKTGDPHYRMGNKVQVKWA